MVSDDRILSQNNCQWKILQRWLSPSSAIIWLSIRPDWVQLVHLFTYTWTLRYIVPWRWHPSAGPCRVSDGFCHFGSFIVNTDQFADTAQTPLSLRALFIKELLYAQHVATRHQKIAQAIHKRYSKKSVCITSTLLQGSYAFFYRPLEQLIPVAGAAHWLSARLVSKTVGVFWIKSTTPDTITTDGESIYNTVYIERFTGHQMEPTWWTKRVRWASPMNVGPDVY